jgi:hypothetical protein
MQPNEAARLRHGLSLESRIRREFYGEYTVVVDADADRDIVLPDSSAKLVEDQPHLDFHLIDEILPDLRERRIRFRDALPTDLRSIARQVTAEGYDRIRDGVWCMTHEQLGTRLNEAGFSIYPAGGLLNPDTEAAIAWYDRGDPVIAYFPMGAFLEQYRD